MTLDLTQLRYRAASQMSLCSRQHVMHRSDTGGEYWVTCDGNELNRLYIKDWVKVDRDPSHEIQLFFREVMVEHEQAIVGQVVTELLDELEQARLRLFQVALAVSDPDKNHVDRCVDVGNIVGSAEVWR